MVFSFYVPFSFSFSHLFTGGCCEFSLARCRRRCHSIHDSFFNNLVNFIFVYNSHFVNSPKCKQTHWMHRWYAVHTVYRWTVITRCSTIPADRPNSISQNYCACVQINGVRLCVFSNCFLFGSQTVKSIWIWMATPMIAAKRLFLFFLYSSQSNCVNIQLSYSSGQVTYITPIQAIDNAFSTATKYLRNEWTVQKSNTFKWDDVFSTEKNVQSIIRKHQHLH